MSAIQYPVADPIPSEMPPLLDDSTVEPAHAPSRRLTRRQVGRAARIIAMAAAAAVVGAAAALMMRPVDPAVAAAPDLVPSEIGGIAEIAVTAYLANGHEGNEAALAPLYGVDLDLTGIPAGQWYVVEAATVGVDPAGSDMWTATVAVGLLGAAGDGYVALGVQYFEIPLATSDGGYVAAGLPGRVDAPEAAPARRPIGEMTPPTGSEFDAAVQGFLTAYLTGNGDIDLYSSPSADLASATTPPFAEVALRRVGVDHSSGGGFLVVAEYVGVDGTGRRIISEARLSVTADWKVLAVLSGLPGS